MSAYFSIALCRCLSPSLFLVPIKVYSRFRVFIFFVVQVYVCERAPESARFHAIATICIHRENELLVMKNK